MRVDERAGYRAQLAAYMASEEPVVQLTFFPCAVHPWGLWCVPRAPSRVGEQQTSSWMMRKV